MNVEYWSPSRLNMLYRCGEQFRRRYVEGEILPPDLGLLRGRATHKSVEVNLRGRMENGSYLSKEEAQDAGADALSDCLGEDYELGAAYKDLGKDKALGHVKDEVVGLSGLHAEKVAPTIEPVAVEERIEVPAIPGCSPLLGVVDIIDNNDVIRDTKTTQKSPSKDAADNSTQLTFYEMIFAEKHGQPSGGQALDYLIRTPSKGDLKVVTQTTSRTDDDLNVLWKRLEVADKMVGAEVFLPTAEDNWACSTRFCGYARTCPYFRGKDRPLT